MAIFRLTALDGSAEVIVRARCLSCARKTAVEHSPADQFQLWSDPSLSEVTLIHHPERLGYDPEGKSGVIA